MSFTERLTWSRSPCCTVCIACGKPSINHCLPLPGYNRTGWVGVKHQFTYLPCLPVCKVYPLCLCLGSGPGSELSSLYRPFHRPRQTIPSCGDRLRVCLSLVGAATSVIFVVTKHVFCRNKSMLAVTKLLSRQNYVCHSKIFFAQTCVCHDKSFVATGILLSWQKNVLSWETCICCDKSKLVTTNVLSQQNYVCHAKRHVSSWHNKFMFDAPNVSHISILLLWQKTCFVMTKMILVAASANDIWQHVYTGHERRSVLKCMSMRFLPSCLDSTQSWRIALYKHYPLLW